MRYFLTPNERILKVLQPLIDSRHQWAKGRVGPLFAWPKTMPSPQYSPIFVDCGAYSARGSDLDADQYYKAIANWLAMTNYPTDQITIAAMDVIGNAQKSWENFLLAKEYNIEVVPTYHLGEPKEYLYRIMDVTNYFALGGCNIAGFKGRFKAKKDWLDACWTEILKRNKEAKVHGFGVSCRELIINYPWSSVDSTSCLHIFSSGYGSYFDKFLNIAERANPELDVNSLFVDQYLNELYDILHTKECV